MGQVLEFCRTCETNRCCDTCADLHEWIMEHMEPRWISVEDELPPLGTEVLVYATEKIEGFGTTYALCEYRNARTILGNEIDRPEWSTPWQYFHTDYEITHWMPLPPGPKEG